MKVRRHVSISLNDKETKAIATALLVATKHAVINDPEKRKVAEQLADVLTYGPKAEH